MATQTKIPSIPKVSQGTIISVLQALKEIAEIREGLRGLSESNARPDRFISFRELARVIVQDSEVVSKLRTGHNHYSAPTTVTISSGVATISTGSGNYRIDTEGGASSDDLDKIAGLSEGDIIILGPASDSRTVVLKDGTYLKLEGDFTMDNQYDRIVLECVGSDVCAQLCRANNGA